MLYSPCHRFALARHPKTASTSLTAWFESTFPDAITPNAIDPHVPVREGLEQLSLLRQRHHSLWPRFLARPFVRKPGEPIMRERITIIGVLREPFEMLVALYEYWRRRSKVKRHAPHSLAAVAATGSFREFLIQAVEKQRLPNYVDFFDVGGAAWPMTRLVDFRCLEAGLRSVCRDHGIESQAAVPAVNISPGAHDFDGYRDEVANLLPSIHSRYRWYYEEAEGIMTRGESDSAARAA